MVPFTRASHFGVTLFSTHTQLGQKGHGIHPIPRQAAGLRPGRPVDRRRGSLGGSKMGESTSWVLESRPIGSKFNHQGTTGFSSWFHLPGFHFGYPFLTHSQLILVGIHYDMLSWHPYLIRCQVQSHGKNAHPLLVG